MSVHVPEFAYTLLPEKIANAPAQPRDHAKLLLLNRQTGEINHHHFFHLAEYLTPNDVLVLNQTKVFPARLYGHKATGGKVEVLLLRQLGVNTWECISKPGLQIGQQLTFDHQLTAQVTARNAEGEITLTFNLQAGALWAALEKIGLTPIPPYITATEKESVIRREYQTVYAKEVGSAAAPTAGMHFTKELLTTLATKGVQLEYLTLHVGPGTFQNLRQENLDSGLLHREYYSIEPETAVRLNAAKQVGKRIIAVGTTTTRALESSWNQTTEQITAGESSTQLFIRPPYTFQFVDSLITNFHLPESSLLMLVTAFTTQPQTAEPFVEFSTSVIGRAYQAAIDQDYRFFSFGDAMWIY